MTPAAEPRLVNASSFEALHRILGKALTPEVTRALQGLGLDYELPLHASYPFETWSRALNHVAALLYPGRPEAERHFELGRRMLDSYGETIVGRVLIAMTQVMGPQRMLQRAARNMRTANNYTVIELRPEGEKAWRAHFPTVVFPDFYRGLLLRGLEVSGAKNAKVVEQSRQGEQADFLCSWD